MTNKEKIEAKRTLITKIKDNIKKYQEKIDSENKKIKKLENDIDQLAIFDIKNLAKEANLPITELRSMLSDLLSESSADESSHEGESENEI